MGRCVFLTGVTGHLGPHLVAALLADERVDEIVTLVRADSGSSASDRIREVEAAARGLMTESEAAGRRRRRLTPIEGRVDSEDLGLDASQRSALERRVDVLIHAAADTRFTAPYDALRGVNVDGTRHACAFAARCTRLRQFLYVSTACVAGRRTGRVPERLFDDAEGFVNDYEQTKWEAEQLVAASRLPARIARLTTCAGSHRTGYVHRFGALHHLFNWIDRGLVPMVPGTPATLVDVISTDVAAAWMARAAGHDPARLEICHVALGDAAVPVEALMEFAAHSTGHRSLIVDRRTFELFQRMVERSGDMLFGRVNASARAVLPGLLYPKVFATAEAERVWGGPLPHPDWRATLAKVMAFGRARRWGRSAEPQACHA